MYKNLKETGKLITKILAFCICIILFNQFIAQRVIVVGEGMEPAYKDGDNLIMERLSYRFTDPERYDVVVIDTKGVYGIIIKRIIGLPGETVYIDENGNIYIDGTAIKESYGAEVIGAENRGLAASEITLGEDEYFVMGDNRNHSGDSRIVGIGNIDKEKILGKIIFQFPFLNTPNN